MSLCDSHPQPAIHQISWNLNSQNFQNFKSCTSSTSGKHQVGESLLKKEVKTTEQEFIPELTLVRIKPCGQGHFWTLEVPGSPREFYLTLSTNFLELFLWLLLIHISWPGLFATGFCLLISLC